MDGAFTNLDDLSDREISERLESLFDSSLPSLDSPILQDHAATAAANILEGTPTNPEDNQILGQLDNATDGEDFGFGNNAQTTVAASSFNLSAASPAIKTTSGSAAVAISSSSVTNSSSTSSLNKTSTSINVLKANVVQAAVTGAISAASGGGPTLAAPQNNIQNNSFILSPQPVMNMATGKLLTSSTPTVIQQGGIQYTLQPAPASAASANAQVSLSAATTQVNGAAVTTNIGAKNVAQKSKAQPQLLPKPASNSSVISTASTVTSCGVASPSISTVVSANAQRPVVSMTQPPASSQQFVLNTSGVISGANTAPLLLTGQTNQHILIQQPGGNPILVMQPQAPATPTILPTIVSTSTAQGTILLQPPAGGPPTAAAAAAGMITAQPQIKIITPQGRMQMQQIQTPSGPKLIAVPVNPGQAAAAAVAVGQPAPTAVVQQPNPSPNVVQEDKSKDKKAKKKAARAAAAAAAAAALQQQQQQTQDTKSGLDLGELMKDVGLDELDGYNNSADPATTTGTGNVMPEIVTTLNNNSGSVVQNTTIISSQGQAIMTTPLALSTSASGNQILAQLQPQQIQVQPAPSNQYQLVQGPDGQFILQQSAPTPTILTQATISGDGLTQGLGLASGSTPLLTASGNLIGAAATVGSLSSPAVNTTVIGQPTSTAVVVPSVVTSTTTAQVSPPKKSRMPPDPNRIPKYHDERLPQGWHRKVSQRKSGASAGRYEVFIIGPTGKRFRSRNELKAFFEKTGETVLQPEHFDFSTFGTNAVNLPKEYQNKNKTNNTVVPGPPTSQDSSGMPKLTPMAPGVTTTTTPQYKSQLSLETAEADAQISQLLDSLKKDSSNSSNKFQIPNVDEKMSELFQISNSLTGADDNNSCSSPPPSIVKPNSAMLSSTSLSSPLSIVTSANALKLDPGAKSIGVTSGTTGFQSAFLSSISPNSAEKQKGSNNSEGSESTSSVPTSVSNGSSPGLLTTSTPNAVSMGGSSTQRRALQNLPQNTKVVRGPNGQYSLQKVQTIELTFEQQNNLRGVQNRIQEIERLPTKSAKDENELAQLHVKQQQILASGRHITSQNVQEQVSLTTATSVVSSLNTSSSTSIVPPVSKSIPVPNVTVTKSTPIRYTHTVGNQVISLPPSGTSGTTTTTATSTTLTSNSASTASSPAGSGAAPAGAQAAAAAAQTAAAITQLTDEQKRIVFEFKQKMAQLPPDQQPAFIAQHKGSLLKQLNFQPTQLQLLRNNHIQLQLSSHRPQVRTLPVQGQNQQQPNAQQKRPLPIGAGTIRQPNDNENNTPTILNAAPVSVVAGATLPTVPIPPAPSNKQKNIAWIENQIRKDQHEAVNPKYKLPFKSKDDAIKRLLRYHVFYDLDSSPEEMVKSENDFEEKSEGLLDKYQTMLKRYHFLLTQESKRLASSSEEVMLARLWDSTERQTLTREKEDVEAGNKLSDVPLLDPEKRQQYSNYLMINSKNETKDEELQHNDKKRKRSGSPSPSDENPKGKYPRGEGSEIFNSLTIELNRYDHTNNDNDNEDSDEEFTLKDVVGKENEQAVGSILGAASSADDDEDDEVDDVLQEMSGTDADVVAAAFGTDSVQNAINSILAQGDRIETPDINNITGLFDSIEDETATERDPMTEAAVNSIPQF